METNSNRKYFTLLIHMIAWILLFCSPFILAGASGRHPDLSQYLHMAGTYTAVIIVFYTNYLLLVNCYLFRRKIAAFFLLNIVLFIFANLFRSGWGEIVKTFIISTEVRSLKLGSPPPKTFVYVWDTLMFVFTAALSVAIKMTAKWYKTEQERKEIEKERSEAELRNLKSQLNPHFLFNTLNNIYSLISVNPEQARESLHGLSNLLRYVLYDNNEDKIPFAREIAFMRSYIELMSLRVHEKVKLEVNIEDDIRNIQIAPLLFIPLVENAFKHGISPIEQSSVIIDIHTDEEPEKGQIAVVCSISNTSYPKTDNDRSGSGIGLENLKKRLALIYPGQYSMTSGSRDGIYSTTLKIFINSEKL
jgi:LytS/YehU family sensor histidine kinase